MENSTLPNTVLYHLNDQGQYVVGTRLFYGEVCIINPIPPSSQHNQWLPCTLETDGYTGFVKHSDYVRARLRSNLPNSDISKSNLSKSIKHTVYIVTHLATFLYPQPSIQHPDAVYLPCGSRVYVDHLSTQNIALEIEKSDFLNTDEGFYVWKAHVTPFHMPATHAVQTLSHAHINQAMCYAVDMLGVPYLWGGRTTSGCDCSGLVQTVYMLIGCILARDSWMQQHMETLDANKHSNIPCVRAPMSRSFVIDSEPLERGDLVFWKGHVGMMEDAQTLIHASGHHMCVVREPLAQARARTTGKTHADVSLVRRFHTTA